MLGLVAALTLIFPADDPAPGGAIQTSFVTIRDPAIPVSRALAELRRQTGVSVQDDRGGKDLLLSLDLDRVSFWRALDAIAAAADARVGLGQDGSLTLRRRPPDERTPPTCYDSAFRIRVQRVTASKDLDSNRGGTVFTLEVTWTPTLRPLFLDGQARGVRLLDARSKAVPLVEERGSLTPVEGHASFPLEVSAPLLPRADDRVALLEGRFHAVAPSKFLTFRYDADLAALEAAVAGGAVRRLEQEDVVCTIDRVVLDKERWSVTVALQYPPGGKALESFQAAALVAHNELLLVSGDGKRSLSPSGYVIDAVSSRRARVTYHFTDRLGARRGPPGQWKPRYSAPARIVEVPVRFRFRDVPLP